VSPHPASVAFKPVQFPVLSAANASLISVVVMDVILLRIKALKKVSILIVVLYWTVILFLNFLCT